MAVTSVRRLASLWSTGKLNSWHFWLEQLQLLIIAKGFTKGIICRCTWERTEEWGSPGKTNYWTHISTKQDCRFVDECFVFYYWTLDWQESWMCSTLQGHVLLNIFTHSSPPPSPKYFNMVQFPKSGALLLTVGIGKEQILDDEREDWWACPAQPHPYPYGVITVGLRLCPLPVFKP